MSQHNKGFSLTAIFDSLPHGLDRELLRILSYHTGQAKAISRIELLDNLAHMGFQVSDRAMRAAINQLRKDGQMICSTGGEDGGYYLPAGWDELNDYLEREVHSRAMDLLEQESALKQAGEKTWGSYSKQERFF